MELRKAYLLLYMGGGMLSSTLAVTLKKGQAILRSPQMSLFEVNDLSRLYLSFKSPSLGLQTLPMGASVLETARMLIP